MRFDSNSPDVMTVRGLLLFLTSKTAQATQHVQSALRLDPGHEAAMKLRKRIKDVERLKEEGNVAFKGGRLSEAAQKYGEALDRIGSEDREGGGGQIRAMLLSNRATTLVKLGRYEDALADTEASLELNATSFKALRTRARINLHLEKFDTAIADFNAAIEQAGFENCDADVRALRAELKKAEIALKRSKTKDYYKILGVSRDCSDADIRKAYRRESLKHHPDKVRVYLWLLVAVHLFGCAQPTAICRVETKRNSSSSWRRTRSCQIHKNVRGTTWARTRTMVWAGWAVSTSLRSLLSSTEQASEEVGQDSHHSAAEGLEEAVSAEAALAVEGLAVVPPSGAAAVSPSDLGERHQPLFASPHLTDHVPVAVPSALHHIRRTHASFASISLSLDVVHLSPVLRLPVLLYCRACSLQGQDLIR